MIFGLISGNGGLGFGVERAEQASKLGGGDREKERER